MARVHLVEVAASSCCPHDLLHVPHHDDGGRHGPPHPRSARGEEDPEETTVVGWRDEVEWQREQSRRRTRTPKRRWTQAEGPE
jgi:hypothetical protein